MEIIAQSRTFGAEVRALDLSIKLSEEQFEQVNQAFLDYQIIFFRDQDLSPQQYNLNEQVTRPEYSFRLRWAENTLAMWDNRCTHHYALNDYHGYRRLMHRIIVEGERPR